MAQQESGSGHNLDFGLRDVTKVAKCSVQGRTENGKKHFTFVTESLLTSALGSAWTMQEISTSTLTSAWIQALSTCISGSSAKIAKITSEKHTFLLFTREYT
jgi:hypothetical protein